MIQFADYWKPSTRYFEARCPVCEAVDVRLSYAWHQPDEASNYRGGPADPSIVDQDCNCLLGQDWVEDALDTFLEQQGERNRNARWYDPRL